MACPNGDSSSVHFNAGETEAENPGDPGSCTDETQSLTNIPSISVAFLESRLGQSGLKVTLQLGVVLNS